jgi:hypothetical protein
MLDDGAQSRAASMSDLDDPLTLASPPPRELPIRRRARAGLDPVGDLKRLLRRQNAADVLFAKATRATACTPSLPTIAIAIRGATATLRDDPTPGSMFGDSTARRTPQGHGHRRRGQRRLRAVAAAIDKLAAAYPALANKVLLNLGRHLSGRLRQMRDALQKLGGSSA